MRLILFTLPVVLLTLLCFSIDAVAQLDVSVIERYYKGSVSYKVGKTQVTVERTMMLRKLYGSDNVMGTFDMAITVIDADDVGREGKKYFSSGQVSGSFDRKKQELYVSIDSYNKVDRLPDDLKWCKGKIIFKVSERTTSGYKLKGTVKDDCKKEYDIVMEG